MNISNGQQLTQIVKGPITDKVSEKALVGASVSVESLTTSALSDVNGFFILKMYLFVALKIIISTIGYQMASIPEILVTTGIEVVLDIPLEQNIASLHEVAEKKKLSRPL